MFLEQMNYLEVEEYLKNHDTVIIPTGSCENHGKHMPLGTDTMIPHKIAQLVNDKMGSEIVIAPTLPYGSTEDLRGFAGTVSIGNDGLILVLTRICDQLFDYGFRHFMILNGHGGNSKAIETVGLHLYNRGSFLARVDWWLLAGQLNPFWKGGHGGGEETAGVMAVNPDLIKYDYINEGENIRNDVSDELPNATWTAVSFGKGTVTIPRPMTRITDNGWMGYGMPDAPSRATPEWGREMVEGVSAYIADFAAAFSRATLPEVK